MTEPQQLWRRPGKFLRNRHRKSGSDLSLKAWAWEEQEANHQSFNAWMQWLKNKHKGAA